MNQSWPEVRLGSLAGFKNGLNYSKKDFGKGLKVIGVSDFSDKGRISSFDGLDEVNAQNLGGNLPTLKNGDILFVRSNGNRELIGRSVLIRELSEQVSFSGFTIRCRFYSDDVLPDYFGYLFRSRLIRDVLSSFGGGTNINNLNQDILSNLKVPLPPLPTQRRIASILSAYDDLIENNTRRVRVLEDMARALYREWFVEYRFPGYEQAEFVEDEQGRRPVGWLKTTLGQRARILMGQAPKSEFYNKSGDGLPFHQGVGTFGDYFPVHDNFCTDLARVAKPGDILFSVRAPVGRTNVANRELVIGRGLSAIHHFDGAQAFTLMQLNDRIKEDSVGNGAIFKAVTKADMHGIEWQEPTPELLKNFEQHASTIWKQIANLSLRNANLHRTRDLLLPRLVSGELDVSDLEIAGCEGVQDRVEEAVA